MHELSVAYQLVEQVVDEVDRSGGGQVKQVNVRIGALTCIHADALSFCFDQVIEGTDLDGARLKLEVVPVQIHCEVCAERMTLPGIQSLRCPTCDTPSADVRQGNELELESIVLNAEVQT